MHAHLTVDVAELFPTLRKVLPRVARRKGLEAVLTFDGEQFSIDFQGAQLGARAVGEWRGAARVSLAMLEGIARTHVGPTIDLKYGDGRVRIGSLSIAAKWQDITPPLLDLAIDASEAELLAICLLTATPQVIASGLGPRFERAKQTLAKQVAAAQGPLATYGISHDEIENFVISRLKNSPSHDAVSIARAWIAGRIDLSPVAWPRWTVGDFGAPEDYIVFIVPGQSFVLMGNQYIAVHKVTGVVHDLGIIGD